MSIRRAILALLLALTVFALARQARSAPPAIGVGRSAVTSGYPETLLLAQPYFDLLTTEEHRERVHVLARLAPGTPVTVVGRGVRRGAHPYYRWYQVDDGRGRIGWVHHLELR